MKTTKYDRIRYDKRIFSIRSVIPAEAGIHLGIIFLDSCLRRSGVRSFISYSLIGLYIFITASPVYSHSIHYDVQPKGISVKIFYAKDNPASYSEYELFGPGDKEPHQIGRTDRNGFLSFLPDRAGTWRIKVWGDSTHGFHGVTVDVKVDQALRLESFSKPFIATHTKLIVGISLIFGLFGIFALYKSRRKISS
jgi:nickel transport protein